MSYLEYMAEHVVDSTVVLAVPEHCFEDVKYLRYPTPEEVWSNSSEEYPYVD